MENISDVDEDDFLRSTAAVVVTVITSVCALNKLATNCGLLPHCYKINIRKTN